MKDYAQYSSRIPAPSYKRTSQLKTPTKQVVTMATSPDRPSSASTASMSSAPSTSPSSRPMNSFESPMRQRSAFDESMEQDTNAEAALAKSDAVILELRSMVRSLKQELSDVQIERNQWKLRHDSVLEELKQAQAAAGNAGAAEIQKLQSQLLAQNSANAQDAKLGELQVQLDRAHAQIITADMVRKELEDTLEAEQYTWDLRMQDQERTIADLQQQVRNRTVVSNAMATKDLTDRIAALERERAELQSCLDEALQELEAVDAELQTNEEEKSNKDKPLKNADSDGQRSDLVEPLQHLLRWIINERSEELDFSESELPNLHSMSDDPKQLMSQIQLFLEQTFSKSAEPSKESNKKLEEMQSQVTAYQTELKTREESNVELRDSLRDAVALLKPLQDAVDKAQSEKTALTDKISALEKETELLKKSGGGHSPKRDNQIRSLEEQVASLQEQLKEQSQIAEARQALLTKARPMGGGAAAAARGSASSSSAESSMTKIQRAREELRRKRESEGNLQQLLRDAQTRFHSLHEQNENVTARNRELQGRLQTAERQLVTAASSGDDNDDIRSVDDTSPEAQLERTQQELSKRNREIESLRSDLERARNGAFPNEKVHAMESELERLRASESQLDQLRKELKKMQRDVSQKEHVERMLNKSLKEALGLLKPLQMHLEDAEQEKMQIAKELRTLRKRFRQLQMNGGSEDDEKSRSTMGGTEYPVELIKIKEELEETVRQLELENSQLHDALEDLSSADLNASGMSDASAVLMARRQGDAKLRQQMVELARRVETTQNQLEDAQIENQSLVKAFKQKESDELRRLRERCERAEAEKNHAKSIAKSALMKVEELTMEKIEQSSFVQEGPMEVDFDLHVVS